MKQVKFQGQYYAVPEWAKFVAKDDNGHIYAYEHKPLYELDRKEWYANSGQYEFIANINMMELG